jgi:hypothetical protein
MSSDRIVGVGRNAVGITGSKTLLVNPISCPGHFSLE